jgi:iron complex outermembrane receptor protein
MIRYKRTLLLTTVSSSAIAWSSMCNGQVATGQTSHPSADVPASNSSGDALEEIVVTANKREQSINDVGLAIDVLSGTQLKDQQISSLADIAKVVPSLSYTTSANSTPVFTLRGIGFYESSIGSYSTVPIYVDEAPLPFPVMTRHSAFDLERIEVLKGPQGTLFGENATGGAINYISAKPTSTFTSGVNASYGRFNEFNGEAFASGPISPDLLFRVAGRVERADGWQESYTRPGDTLGATRNYMGRLLLDFKPTDVVHLQLNINGWIDKSDTQAPQYIGLQPGNPVVPPGLTGAIFSPQTPRAADWTPGLPFGDLSMWQTALRADISLNDYLMLTSLTNFIHYTQRQGDDGDGLPITELDLPLDTGDIKTVSQELRLSNGGNHDFRWVVGSNYEKSHSLQIVDINYSGSSSTATQAADFGYPIATAHYTTDQRFKDYAFFANGEYEILDTVTLKAGTRFTQADDADYSCNADISGNPTDVGPFFYNILLGGAYGPYPKGHCFLINDQGHTIGGVAPGAPGPLVTNLNQNNVSWRTGIDWKIEPGLLTYANIAKGYKAGSFPTVSSSTFTSYLPVRQESVLSYELGFKASSMRQLQINGAAFYYDYRDKQLRSKLEAPPFGILDVLQNIPKSTIKGLEFEVVAAPVDGLSITVSATYLDATIDKFTGINGAGLAGNFAGTPVPFTPKWEFNVRPRYTYPINSDLQAFIGFNVNHRTQTIAVVGGDENPPNATPVGAPLSRIDAYTLVDADIGVSIEHAANSRTRLSLYGKNILNEYYWNNVVTTADTVGRYTGRPATFGVAVDHRF